MIEFFTDELPEGIKSALLNPISTTLDLQDCKSLKHGFLVVHNMTTKNHKSGNVTEAVAVDWLPKDGYRGFWE